MRVQRVAAGAQRRLRRKRALRGGFNSIELGDRISTRQYDFVFASRRDADLRDAGEVEALFKVVRPTVVLHCAAALASIKEMSAKPVEFWLDNVAANNNVLKNASKFGTWCGKIKVFLGAMRDLGRG